MPRKARIDAPGALHHIIVRGIEKRNIFLDDTDRNNFLNRLEKILLETNTACFAWALLPNHFHLLLRTGAYPLATVMRRLLTGHAMNFNRRHARVGKLFQNRYKSILCQEDSYLLELVRYIHLNPLRAGLIAEPTSLDTFAFCGHAVLMGKIKNDWQDHTYILRLFADQMFIARKKYKRFVLDGVLAGKRPELIGGGLLRSNGGWAAIKSLRRQNYHLKSDERILGDSDFVENVLNAAEEQLERKYELRSKGYDLQNLSLRVSEILSIKPGEILKPGKQPERVKARSLLCFWAVRELGYTMAELALKLDLSQPAISTCVRRGEKIVEIEGYSIA
jgi:REP element-mobilizing transposase RayT